MVGSDTDVDNAIAAQAVAHLNLVDALIELGQVDAAGDQLILIHGRLLRLAKAPAVSRTVREAAGRHSARTRGLTCCATYHDTATAPPLRCYVWSRMRTVMMRLLVIALVGVCGLRALGAGRIDIVHPGSKHPFNRQQRPEPDSETIERRCSRFLIMANRFLAYRLDPVQFGVVVELDSVGSCRQQPVKSAADGSRQFGIFDDESHFDVQLAEHGSQLNERMFCQSQSVPLTENLRIFLDVRKQRMADAIQAVKERDLLAGHPMVFSGASF